MESLTINLLIYLQLLILSIASFEKIPCVIMHITSLMRCDIDWICELDQKAYKKYWSKEGFVQELNNPYVKKKNDFLYDKSDYVNVN